MRRRWTKLVLEPLESRIAPALMHTNFIRYDTGGRLHPDQGSATPTGMTPAMMRHAYGADAVSFGSVTGDGTGQTIAVIDAFNQPNTAALFWTAASGYIQPDCNWLPPYSRFTIW